ncbi:hypothetical protein [Sporosarcina gallistercoris]|uniref:Uncharacterized protein n=1 Tax=Sporosarcina gallistercoris TaxID=2762245 RepID=A0ABR8PHR6_9BACL|nr:hypothetical protein [Sporosarcina gallistercoris]MBD7907717.1 hypothetical protein [Sporosarcina gallistercoris]
MSKWTGYQLATACAVILGLIGKHYYISSIHVSLESLPRWIDPTIAITFVSIIGTVWSTAAVVYWQARKNGQFFTHKIWRILPVLLGVLFVLSFIGFVVLGSKVFASITQDQQWQIDVVLLYFLALMYLFVLSVVHRYGSVRTSEDLIVYSANCTVLVLLIILFFVPHI